MWELILPTIAKLIDKVLPDPAAALAAKTHLLDLQASGSLAELKAETDKAVAQIAVDQAEAASSDPLQHWRGALGWVCAFAYFWNFVALPMATFAATAAGHPLTLPIIDGQPLYTLTGGMLGLGTMHTIQTIMGNK